jgi:hypothetical protein
LTLARTLRVDVLHQELPVKARDMSTATKFAASHVRHSVRFSQVTTYPPAMSIWTKLAWTPVTLTVDLSIGLLANAIVSALQLDFLTDDDDCKPGNSKLNTGVSGAQPRRAGESEREWRARELSRARQQN